MYRMNDLETALWRLVIIALFIVVFNILSSEGMVPEQAITPLVAVLTVMAMSIALPLSRVAMSLVDPVKEMLSIESEGEG